MAAKLLKKISVLLTAGILAATSVSLAPVQAAESSESGCTITIQMEIGANSQPVTDDGGNLEIYRIADVQSDDEGYYYNVLPDFEEWREEDESNDLSQYRGEKGQAFEENNSKWAEELASYVAENSIEPIETDDFNKGYLEVAGLSGGVYLMVQTEAITGYEKLSPFLVAVSKEQETSGATISARPKMAKLEQKETPTPNPEPTKKPTTPTHTGDKLPQTGQLWWPIPILIAAGVVLIVVGTVRRKKSKG